MSKDQIHIDDINEIEIALEAVRKIRSNTKALKRQKLSALLNIQNEVVDAVSYAIHLWGFDNEEKSDVS